MGTTTSNTTSTSTTTNNNNNNSSSSYSGPLINSGILNQPYSNLNAPGSYFIPGHHPNRRTSKSQAQQYVVTVPPNTKPGEKFRVLINNQEVLVTCPPGVRPSQRLTFTLPDKKPGTTPPNRYLYEVTVPPGFQPGQPFVLVVGDQRVRVTCPPNARPGEKVRFQLPAHIQQKELESIKVDYDIDGWIRCNGEDFKFHWVYNSSKTSSKVSASPINTKNKTIINNNNNINNNETNLINMNDNNNDNNNNNNNNENEDNNNDYDNDDNNTIITTTTESPIATELLGDAYVRNIIPPTEENPLGGLEFIEATAYRMASTVPGTSIDSYELASIASLSYPKKVDWLKSHFTSGLRKPWEDGHYKIKVRRGHLLADSVDSLLSIPPSEMNRIFRYEFLNEPGMDAGGLAREWFQLVSNQIFNPNFGLFLSCDSNQMCLKINPHSDLVHEDYLKYFYFVGRFLGRALFDTQLIPQHFVLSFYKQLMGFPLSFYDVESLDERVYRSLMEILQMESVDDLGLDFTITEELLGVQTVIPLIPNGADILVTNENKREYIKHQLHYRLFDSIKNPLHQILKGFYEVMSEPLLAVLSPQELELFLHGLPQIDIIDWMKHTEYTGEFAKLISTDAASVSSSSSSSTSSSNGSPNHGINLNNRHEVCRWFWEIVSSYSQEYRAKLLQFSTGTSGVPSLGFGALQGNDGNIRLFTIHGDPNLKIFPRSHTCFNRIDLPLYQSKEEMQKFLTLAITCESVGFGLQ